MPHTQHSTRETGAHLGLLTVLEGWQGDGSPGTHGAREASAPQLQGKMLANTQHDRMRGLLSLLAVKHHGRGRILAAQPGPTAPLAPFLYSEVLGHTSEESGTSEQQSESKQHKSPG